MDKIEIGYWTDPLCIWAFVAQQKLDRVLARWPDQLVVDYRMVPIFGSIPWRFEHGQWATQGVEGRVEASKRIAHEFGFSEVDGSVWRDDTPASSWPASMAIKAVSLLEKKEEVRNNTLAEFQWRLRKKFFIDNQNIARREVIMSVAEQMQFSVSSMQLRLDDGSAFAALWEDFQEKERLKIQGSPTYVFDNGRAQLYGNFSYRVLEATIQALLDHNDPGCTSC